MTSAFEEPTAGLAQAFRVYQDKMTEATATYQQTKETLYTKYREYLKEAEK